MNKDEVAEIFEEIAVLLELVGENPFKSRAYTSAARTLQMLEIPLEPLLAEDRLHELKGIGTALQEKIAELVRTGNLPYYEKLKSSIAPGLLEMLEIPGLGPKKVKAIHSQLGIDTLDQLEDACRQDRVAQLIGFGAKTQDKIQRGIDFRRRYASRFRLDQAWAVAEEILADLRAHPDVTRCSLAGSLRRSKETVGDLDFLVSSRQPASVLEYFTRLEGVQEVRAHGDTKASVVLESGIQADLRVVKDAEFAFALAYFTGSKEHNIGMRQRAIERGLRLNEYGLSPATAADGAEKSRECQTEEALFRELGLDYIPPELREDQGEFEAAESGRIPRLLEWTELRGSLHNHSNWSDGRATLEEIAAHMDELGCEYWAITDHSKSSVQANGLDAGRLRQQIRALAELNRKLTDEDRGIRLLTGSEVDILSGGKLDFEDDLLAELEVVVASIHSGFTQSEAEMTRRLIAAAENPFVHMLGHLTGRLLLEREAYAVNQRAVIDACAETGTWIELNASPHRMDLDWRLWKYARDRGVKCVINCDAHRNAHAGYLRLGAGIARKGWLTRADVINALPLNQLFRSLRAKRKE